MVRISARHYSIEKPRCIGCLGLSANPPHLGHVEAARIVLRSKFVDEVWLIPCFAHSFDKELALVKHRWQMAKFLETKRVRVSDVEIRRGGKSYTIDTVRELRLQHPHYEFFWIIGSDIVKTKSYKKWKDWKKLLRLIRFLVIIRPGYEIKKLPQDFILAGKASKAISSTQIRKRIHGSFSVDRVVPQKVSEYITKQKLYK